MSGRGSCKNAEPSPYTQSGGLACVGRGRVGDGPRGRFGEGGRAAPPRPGAGGRPGDCCVGDPPNAGVGRAALGDSSGLNPKPGERVLAEGDVPRPSRGRGEWPSDDDRAREGGLGGVAAVPWQTGTGGQGRGGGGACGGSRDPPRPDIIHQPHSMTRSSRPPPGRWRLHFFRLPLWRETNITNIRDITDSTDVTKVSDFTNNHKHYTHFGRFGH